MLAPGAVLILVVVEDVLVQLDANERTIPANSLNPCCSGRCSSTIAYQVERLLF